MAFADNGGFSIWPDAVIPYLISTNFTDAQRQTVEEAIEHWNERTIVRLIELDNTSGGNFVLFKPVEGVCQSRVGRQGDEQIVGCDVGPSFKKPAVIHEIGHAFGFQHEHLRPDRDQFITVDLTNIKLEHLFNYDPPLLGAMLTDYDLGSIMHYRRTGGFAKDPGKDIITPHDPNVEIGKGTGLSPLDILGVNLRYGAPHYSVVFQDDRRIGDTRGAISWSGLTRWGKYSASQKRAHSTLEAVVRNPTVDVDEDRNSIIAYEHFTTQENPITRLIRLFKRLLGFKHTSTTPKKTHISMVAFRSDGKHHFGDRHISSTASDDNGSPDLALHPWGDFVLVWVEERNGLLRVKGRGYFNNGTTRFPLRNLVSGLSGVPSNPVVGMTSDRQFVVAWAELDDQGGQTVRARRFHSDGQATSSAVLTVASGLGDSAVFPRLAVGFEGDFYVAWTREGHQVFVRGFKADDSQRFAAVEVSPVAKDPDPNAAPVLSSDSGKHHQPDIALISGRQRGAFRLVVVWTEEIAKPSSGVFVDRDETALGSSPSGGASGPGVSDGSRSQPTALSRSAAPLAAFDTAGVAIDRIERSGQIRARVFFVSGSEFHPQFTVNLGAQGDQRRPRIAAFAEDGYVVTWQDDFDRNGFYQIHAQRFDGEHNPTGGLQVVNQVAQGQQRQPAIGA